MKVGEEDVSCTSKITWNWRKCLAEDWSKLTPFGAILHYKDSIIL